MGGREDSEELEGSLKGKKSGERMLRLDVDSNCKEAGAGDSAELRDLRGLGLYLSGCSHF